MPCYHGITLTLLEESSYVKASWRQWQCLRTCYKKEFHKDLCWVPVWLLCPEGTSCVRVHANSPLLPHVFVFVIWKVRSHLAALKSSSSSTTSSNSSASPAPPAVSRSHSFSESLAPSFENLQLRNSQESHQHYQFSSPSSSSSTPARTDPQPHPQPRPSPHETTPTQEVPPRVRTGAEV